MLRCMRYYTRFTGTQHKINTLSTVHTFSLSILLSLHAVLSLPVSLFSRGMLPHACQSRLPAYSRTLTCSTYILMVGTAAAGK